MSTMELLSTNWLIAPPKVYNYENNTVIKLYFIRKIKSYIILPI